MIYIDSVFLNKIHTVGTNIFLDLARLYLQAVLKFNYGFILLIGTI